MVVYLVCFDLSATPQDQLEQVLFWLQFLNSSVPNLLQTLSSANANKDKNWRVMIVGLKSDAKQKTIFTSESINSWQYQMKNLPLFNRLFEVSSLRALHSVRELLDSVSLVCAQIFENHTVLIPSSFRKLLHSIQNIDTSTIAIPSSSSETTTTTSMISDFPSNSLIVPFHQLHQILQNEHKMDIPSFRYALHYLHSIGHIVFLEKSGLVCTNPTMIPKLLAKFISPEEVQANLLSENSNVQILSEEQIGHILQIQQDKDKR